MSAKLKAMFKKQISLSMGHPGQVERHEIAERSSICSADGRIRTQELRRSVSESVSGGEIVTLRRSNSYRRRQRSSLGVLEDIIICPICKKKLQSPKMLDCQHTFCRKCLEIKLEESSKNDDSEKILSCPVCSSTTTLSTSPEKLPTNLSVERVLRAVDNGSFVGRVPDKANSLVVNFAPLIGKKKEEEKPKCAKCLTGCELPADSCRHCDLVFCNVCQTQHVAQLKDQLKAIIDQLQSTINKLEHRVVEFKDKTESLKDVISKEYDAKFAALLEEKNSKLAMVEELWAKGEDSARVIKKLMQNSQVELAKQKDVGFDVIADNDEKVNIFLYLHKKATEMISKGLAWQSTLPDTIEVKSEEVKLRDRDSRTAARPKLLNLRNTDLQRPSGLAIDSRRGDIYVACPGSNQVVVLDRLYRIVRRIQNQSMMAPQGVTFVESRQEVFVTDKWKHTIFVYNRKGQLIRNIGSEKGSGELQFHSPWGIACLQSRDWLYVADMRNDRIQIVGADGTYKGTIAPNRRLSGSEVVGRRIPAILGVHEFNEPTDVAVSDAAIVVADSGNHKIKVFNHRGQLMFTIGGFGVFRGLLKSPEVVKLDAQGNIYVGDSDNKRVQVFTPQGEFLRVFGSQGSNVGHFGWISGLLCLPNSSDVLVADSINNALQLF